MQVMETIQLLGGDGDGIEGWLGKRSGEASEDSAGLRPFPRLLRFVRFSALCIEGEEVGSRVQLLVPGLVCLL